MIPRYLMAALRVHSDEDVRRVSRSEGLRPDRLRSWAKATKESAPDPGRPDVRLACASRTSVPSRPPGPSRAAGARSRRRRGLPDTSRCVARGHRPDRLRTNGIPGLVRRGPGVRPGAVAGGRGPARGRRPPGAVAAIARGGAWATQRAAFATVARDAPLAVVFHRTAIPPRPGGGEGVAGERGHRTVRDDPGPALRPTAVDPERRRPSLAHVRPRRCGGADRAYLEFADTHDARPPRHGPAGRLRSRWVRRRRKRPRSLIKAAGIARDRGGDRPARRRAGRFAARPRRALWARRVRIARGAGRWLIARPVRRRGTGPSCSRGSSSADCWNSTGGDRTIGAMRRIFREIEARLPEPRRAPAMAEGTPEDEQVFLRGNPKTVGPIVPRRMLSALASDRSTTARAVGSGRLDLARRIADPANPLTARVAVNRIWHHLFGRGLVLPSTISGRSAIDPPIRSCSTTSPIGSSATAGRSRGWCASWSSAARSEWPARRRPSAEASRPRQPALAPDVRPSAGGRGHPRRDPGRLRSARRTDGRPRRRGPSDAVHGQLRRQLRPPQGQRPARRQRAPQCLPQRSAELPDADPGRLRHAPAAGHGRPTRRVERACPGVDPDERPVRRPAGAALGRARAGHRGSRREPAGSVGCTGRPTRGRHRRPS